VTSITLTEGSIAVEGWVIPPRKTHLHYQCFEPILTINDKPFDKTTYWLPREDIGHMYWYRPKAAKSGFTCNARAFKYINPQTNQPWREEHNYYYFNPEAEIPPVPDKERRMRVHGSSDEVGFRLHGYSIYMKLKMALRKICDKEYESFGKILDWGCGCGRVTRYLNSLKNPTVTGTDVDLDNINWCKEHLEFADFATIPLHPPTTLKDSVFDLILGVSVFTHLGEETQFEWLAELQRIAADGAVLLMTIHSDATVCRANLDYDLYRLWRKKGFLEEPNKQLDDIIEESDYYKNSFHTSDYIKRRWSEYFEIIDIVHGYIGNHQDLVIMKNHNT
jgi:2-polyprenyl-3-methyl-5-hydroxy-6-metoxy-1,4-benzoquinol methylase